MGAVVAYGRNLVSQLLCALNLVEADWLHGFDLLDASGYYCCCCLS